jgi:light-regulated signal transduction histidine kinase (bacteriophytochrome)
MLQEIQQRDLALQRARDQLELRVSERTHDLVSANRELQAFSYSVSHDLRGPLDSLIGFSYVLLKQHGAKLDAPARELIGHIRTSGKRMADLVDDLLNLLASPPPCAPKKSTWQASPAPSWRNSVASSPNATCSSSLPKRRKRAATRACCASPMDNLLRNAWKYTSQHDHARIEFGTTSSSVLY